MTEKQQTATYQRGALALQLKHRAVLLLTVAFCAAIIYQTYPRKTYLESIIESGKITVSTQFSPSNYYVENDQPGGFEYELIKSFTDYIGVELNIISAIDRGQVLEALRLNNANFAASSLAETQARKNRFDFSSPYATRKVHVVYLQRQGFSPAESIDDISNDIRVPTHSGYADIMERLDPDKTKWTASENENITDLLESIHQQNLTYTLVDADTFNANRSFFPRLKIAFTLPEKLNIAWMTRHRKDQSLITAINDFMALSETKDAIAELNEKYFAPTQTLNLVDTLTFRRHLEDRLPLYQEYFIEAAEQTGLDWQFLAAMGYQESHWNPRAVSPTGVRGLMMLTRNTAKEMNIEDRTDAKQSIFGGARYFAQQTSRIPERIQGPDRVWFGLAIYNVGRGHLEDARILTERAGMNPDKWDDVAKHLPLLSQAKWYKTVKHGYARGREPVIYVRNIRKYLEQLELESRLQSVQTAQEEGERRSYMLEEANPANELLPKTL